MVLDGLKGFQSKKSKFKTFNYKSADIYLVLPRMWMCSFVHNILSGRSGECSSGKGWQMRSGQMSKIIWKRGTLIWTFLIWSWRTCQHSLSRFGTFDANIIAYQHETLHWFQVELSEETRKFLSTAWPIVVIELKKILYFGLDRRQRFIDHY